MNIFLFLALIILVPAFANPDYAASSLLLISGSTEFCSEGSFRVVGEKEEAILMVGSVVSFPLIQEESTHASAEGKCRETTKRTIDKNKITQTTLISNCSNDLKKLEGSVLQELEILPEQIIYKRTEDKKLSTCLYKRKLE